MAHCKPEHLTDLANLLEQIRTLELKEKSLGCFYLKGKGVLHFHISKERRYAHVWSGKSWQEVDIPTPASIAAQKKYFSQIRKILSV